MTRRVLVEACVDSVESALAAERGGAARLELCDALYDGGTTPSAGMISAVKSRAGIPVFAIIRPRGGGFIYTAEEVDVMHRDILVAKHLGVDGVVIGALTSGGEIDVNVTRALITAARPLPVAFHRAFDLVRDLGRALEMLAGLGVVRVLTSGGAATALEGAGEIRALVTRSAGRVAILAGGGIREENVAEVVARGGVAEVHVRGTRLSSSGFTGDRRGIRFRKALPDDEDAWDATDENRIRALVTSAQPIDAPR